MKNVIGRGPLTGASVGLVLATLAIAVFVVIGEERGATQTAQQQAVAAPVTRTYYVAADEVEWDYAPTGSNQITGEPFGEEENVFVERGPDRIGKVYTKALYREYRNASFNTLKPRPASEEYLGTLGPVLRGAVGDTIKVVFKNNTTSGIPFTMHPHGVFYDKGSEGAPYNDGTSGADKDDDFVEPGGTHTYTWKIPERAGPGPMDPSSVMWMYHSHVDESDDTNSGLIGPIVVTARSMAKPDGSPRDVDREFINMFTVFDENHSHYLDQNIATIPSRVITDDEELKADDGFIESNLMHSINGYVYGNMPMMTMKKGERVRWYLMGMGTEVDLHTPHWHGNTVTVMGMRTDVAELLPASMKVADMKPDNPGTWLYHCHVNDHIDAGMIARFKVNP
jgi:FtsP/CotA-like multicopper oxidase with cupredoxin domain